MDERKGKGIFTIVGKTYLGMTLRYRHGYSTLLGSNGSMFRVKNDIVKPSSTATVIRRQQIGVLVQ